MTQFVHVMQSWLASNANRIIFLLVVLIATAAIAYAASKALWRLLEHSQIPSATFFVNIVIGIIWIIGAMMVLEPVFGINPTTLSTALGVGGLAVSFGLKDTISNIVGGLGLMLGKVVQPGDLISIAGITGTVKDVTWRHTIVIDRAGEEMWIPNSLLNTSSLEKMTPAGEALTRIPFVVKGTADPAIVEQKILAKVSRVTNGLVLPERPTLVKLQGFDVTGIKGEIWVFAKQEVLPSTLQDLVTRTIAGEDFLAG
ncbi:MAG: mechanosensitive ion channel domain-containing protein [Bifidobacterium aquikefiri]|uniref:mechanosensitive ion channel family protein n=1 Tax=Bifidobacterium aquikefiri TaxID=1653207 RepID=UPI0039EA0BDA